MDFPSFHQSPLLDENGMWVCPPDGRPDLSEISHRISSLHEKLQLGSVLTPSDTENIIRLRKYMKEKRPDQIRIGYFDKSRYGFLGGIFGWIAQKYAHVKKNEILVIGSGPECDLRTLIIKKLFDDIPEERKQQIEQAAHTSQGLVPPEITTTLEKLYFLRCSIQQISSKKIGLFTKEDIQTLRRLFNDASLLINSADSSKKTALASAFLKDLQKNTPHIAHTRILFLFEEHSFPNMFPQEHLRSVFFK